MASIILNARLDLPISDAVRRGLCRRRAVDLELDLDIERVRQLLPNSRVAELTSATNCSTTP